MTAAILAYRPRPMHFPAAHVEQTARALALADGVLQPSEPFAVLAVPEQQHYRSRARLALASGTRRWTDAERFAREYVAHAQSSKAFECLPEAERADIAHVVHVVATALEAYMDGTAEPITDWHRQHTSVPGETA